MANRKVKMQARMLTDGEVSSVSLVNRGANRLPFRIQKMESTIMSRSTGFDALFLKKSAPQLTLAGMLVPRAKADQSVTALKEDGFEVKDREDVGENATFLKFDEGATTEGASIAGAVNGSAAVVHNMKSFTSYPDTKDFDENLKASAFFPGVFDATMALEDTLRAVLYDVDAKEPPVEEVRTALDAFSTHIIGLVQSLPATVFKMENLYKALGEDAEQTDDAPEADKATTEKTDAGETGEASATGDEKTAEQDNAETGEKETAGTSEETAATPDKEVEATGEGEKTTEQKSDKSDGQGAQTKQSKGEDDPVLQAVAGLKASMEERFKTLEDGLSETREVANSAKETAQKADKAMNGTVANDEAGDRETARKKQEGAGTFEDGFNSSSRSKSDGGSGLNLRVENY